MHMISILQSFVHTNTFYCLGEANLAVRHHLEGKKLLHHAMKLAVDAWVYVMKASHLDLCTDSNIVILHILSF